MTPEELLKRIEKANRDGDTILDLTGEGLTELPPEIGQLTQLTNLDVRGNQLTSLPSEISQLTNLKELSISWSSYTNPLTTLPLKSDG